jgi:uncharacterized damage-inducible protein DinB
MSLELIRGLYDYHWWANRRLCEHAAGLGEEMAGREVGRQFSYATVRRMLAHIYGADAIWLSRWKGGAPTEGPGADIATLAALRERWEALEAEQRAFLDTLTPADLARTVDYKNIEGKPFRAMLGVLLQHVPNHATHHRSEVATMVTMLSGSPPDSGLVTYELIRSGQLRP